MVATALLVRGSIRASCPALLLAIQMPPAPAVMPPSESAGAIGIVFWILPVVKEARTKLWEPQLGIQRLPYAATKPEQGSFTLMVKPTVLSPARNCLTSFLDEIVTHTASLLTAIQSGSPPTSNVASGFSSAISLRTPLCAPVAFTAGPLG